jgi:ribosome-associated protein
VNKVETKVTVTFDFMSSKSLTWEEKGRLGQHILVLQNLDSEGALAVTSQAHRSQALNREDAVRKLHELLAQALRRKRKRIPTKKTRSSDRKRLEGKKARSQSKTARRRVNSHTED